MNLLDFGEGDDLVELADDLGALHAEDGAVEVDVLAAGELGMKAGADFEQAADAPADDGAAFGRLGDAGEDFQERALARAVAADDADDFAALDLEGDVAERPEGFLVGGRPQAAREPVERRGGQAADFLPARARLLQRADPVALAEVVHFDDRVGHVAERPKLSIWRIGTLQNMDTLPSVTLEISGPIQGT